MNWLAGVSGILLFLLVASEVFEVMLLPRRVKRSLRFVRIYFRSTWRGWTSVARSLPAGPKSDNFLSLYGPLSMVFLLSFWVFGLILALGLFNGRCNRTRLRIRLAC